MTSLILGNLANLVFASAYLVRDFARLRVLSAVGCSLGALFQYVAPAEPLWTGVVWNIFFAAINCVALLRRKRVIR